MKAKDRISERALAMYAISKLREQESAARLQIYDYVFDRLHADLSENTHRPATEAELHLILSEAAIKFDF